jgi:hypothetical protein
MAPSFKVAHTGYGGKEIYINPTTRFSLTPDGDHIWNGKRAVEVLHLTTRWLGVLMQVMKTGRDEIVLHKR